MHHLYKSTKPRKMVYEFIRMVYFSGLPQTSILLISVDSTWPFGKAVPNKFKEILPFLAFLHLTPPAPHLPAALVTADYYPPSKSHCLTASVQHFILQSFSNIIVVFLLPAHTCWEPLNSLSTMLHQFRKNAHYCFPTQPRFCPSCRQLWQCWMQTRAGTSHAPAVNQASYSSSQEGAFLSWKLPLPCVTNPKSKPPSAVPVPGRAALRHMGTINASWWEKPRCHNCLSQADKINLLHLLLWIKL